MIRQIAPQFFTTDIPGTLAYYKEKLGFECLGTWQDPPIYAIVARPPASNTAHNFAHECTLGTMLKQRLTIPI